MQNFQHCISLLVILLFLAVNVKCTSNPNIILIVTDDQDVVLQGMAPMYQTQQLIGSKGMSFMNAFTSSPICCPSRSSILSGMYAHNHQVKYNSLNGGCYSDKWKQNIEPKNLPVMLQRNGYNTFFIGKYLNQYKEARVPPGWSNFYGLHGNSVYYNYTMTENGQIVNYSNEYLTDVIGNKTIEFLRNESLQYPFFAMITPPAPHAPYTPADRHKGAFNETKALRTPSFNLISGPLDKHWLVSSGEKLSDKMLDTLDIYYRKRWEALLAVDEMVANIIHYLDEIHQLENTYIVYTSDNGYHIGQFAQPFDKRQLYETDIRVPLLVRGPNIPEKSISSYPAVLIDLYPTILDWAGIPLAGSEDGVSLKNIVSNAEKCLNEEIYHRQILIEYWGEGSMQTYNPECPYKVTDLLAYCTLEADCHCQDSWNNTYNCIRHFDLNTNKIYCEFKDKDNFIEAYDLTDDPHQLENVGYTLLPSERAIYSLTLKNLTICMGESCKWELS